jgi:hypothetical protein
LVALLSRNPRSEGSTNPASPRSARRLSRAERRRDRPPLQLLQGSFSARRVERQSPLLAGLHRISSGVLAGLGLTVVILGSLSAHWQGVWARNYTQLQVSRSIEQKLQESAALLEQHHLAAVRKPGQLVPTSSKQLLHLNRPPLPASPKGLSLLAGLPLQRIPAGY